ncbi:MAG TPA: hypothetical protein VL400_10280 [Polyangiaceae bacterium]|jgi:hypothetical protein|nr:hypothetical protein [Polyangiaceae bacterium]
MSSVPPAAVSLPDEDGLFSALCLAPGTYSRNQFFDLYRHPGARRAQRRASLVRSLARQMARLARDGVPHQARISATDDGFVVELDVPDMGLRRRTVLSPIERDALDYLVARARAAGAVGGPPERIEHALARLSRL